MKENKKSHETEQKVNTPEVERSRSGRYRTKPVTRQEKWQYFKDYYLLYVVIGVLALVVVGFFVYNTVFDRHETAITVTVLTETNTVDTATLQENLEKELGITDENVNASVTWMEPAGYQTSMAMMAWTSAGEVDIVLADKDMFEQYSSVGYLSDLQEILPADVYTALGEHIVEGAENITDNQGTVTGQKEAKAYGVSVAYDSSTGSLILGDDMIFCIMANAKNQEEAIQVLSNLVS